MYADTSLANNRDYTTQLGYIVLLDEDIGGENWLQLFSYESKSVVRSVLGGETYDLSIPSTSRIYSGKIRRRW